MHDPEHNFIEIEPLYDTDSSSEQEYSSSNQDSVTDEEFAENERADNLEEPEPTVNEEPAVVSDIGNGGGELIVEDTKDLDSDDFDPDADD